MISADRSFTVPADGYFSLKASTMEPTMKRSSKSITQNKLGGRAVARNATHEENALKNVSDSFSIVGIGASAGGLEAIELFLKNVPADSGMAFVIIQHLDPTRKGILTELLQRTTAMTTMLVRDRTKVKPNHIYVIPSNKDMSILHGVLHLFNPTAPRGLRLPIDFFFRSLALDLQERGIAVILSGMGTDGTLGIRTIKEKGGVVAVQEPSTAKFDGMPRSALDSGMADFIAPPGELPAKITGYLHLTPLPAPTDSRAPEQGDSALEKAVILLRMSTGHDFSQYKKSTLYRRIERRMGVHQIDKINTYIRFLQENSQELELLFRELLIGVTNFFRDPAEWAALKARVIPKLIEKFPVGHRTLRAWVPGCSTGEEAYSLAIVFKESMDLAKPKERFTLQVFATDLDKNAVEKARQGLYPVNIAVDVSSKRLDRFFIREGNNFRVVKEIREMVIFAAQDLVLDPPFTKLDILSCRNLLIYLTQEMQKKLLPLFHYSLNPGGILFLGSAESIDGFTDLFTPIEGKSKLYKRNTFTKPAESIQFPSASAPAHPNARAQQYGLPPPDESFQSQADRFLLQRFSPAAVLVNQSGDIIYSNGRTAKYLELPAGKANLNIFAMAREEVRYELTTVFQKARRQKEAVFMRDLSVSAGGVTQTFDLIAQTVQEPKALQDLVALVFSETTASPVKTKLSVRSGHSHDCQLAELENEFARIQDELRISRDEMHSSQEELRAANEELQSTNEELQSTNEELTTSKEEMQSLNEELQTVNTELQVKVDELSRMNNDMKNLLDSTEIATVFLTNDLKVRRFTVQASKVIKLIATDVGRPIMDLSSILLYPDLIDDAKDVLRTLAFREKQITTRDKRRFAVRIMPYRTLENVIDGVVITFTDIGKYWRMSHSIVKKTKSGIAKAIKPQ
jgi:chemotaxis methyl-accepting protein methylase